MTNTLITSINSLVPYWANSVLNYLKLGNEYGILINLLLSELINIIISTQEKIVKNLKIQDNLEINNIYIIAITIITITIISIFYLKNKHNEYTIDSSDCNFDILTLHITENYNIKNTITINNINYINEINNLKLEDDLWTTSIIEKITLDNKPAIVTVKYIFKSKHKNLVNFIKSIIEKYNIVTYIVNPKNEICYDVKALTYYLTKVNKYNKINNFSLIDEKKHNFVHNDPDKIKKIIDLKNTGNIKKNVIVTSLLETCNNYKINDDIRLFIKYSDYDEIKNACMYKLISKNNTLNDFINNCGIEYENHITNTFKYSINLSHYMTLTTDRQRRTPDETFIKINYLLIDKYNIKNYNIINGIKLLINVNNLIIDDKFIISIKEESLLDDIFISLIISSNIENPKKLIDESMEYYEQKNSKQNITKIYHLKYVGNKKFIKSLLHDYENENFQLNEDFNNIFNEHTESINDDIKKLNDDNYYKKSGMKLKKSYLFYGESGTGKTSMVMAIAKKDKRHIIEIPLNHVNSNEEYQEITNSTIIEDIPMIKENILFFLDEIDLAFDKVNRNYNKQQNENLTIINTSETDIDIKNKTKLDISSLLTFFDGIGNYRKTMIIASTNNIDKLDPSIYRDLRLTKKHFTKLRKIDVIKMIETFVEIELTDEQKNKIIDRYIIPATLINLLDNNKKTIDEFLDDTFIKID